MWPFGGNGEMCTFCGEPGTVENMQYVDTKSTQQVFYYVAFIMYVTTYIH